MPTAILSKKDVAGLLNMKEVINVLEEVFRNAAYGKTKMPPKAYLTLEHGDFRAMPASIPGASGLKWVNVHPNNPLRGLPTVMAVLIFNDPDTGYPLAVMDATDITAYRTGASAAIASKYLARNNAHSLGIIGAGRQAYSQLEAHAELFKFDVILVYDVSQPAVERFVKYFSRFPVRGAELTDAAAADIVCTLTPSREPYYKKDWLVPGVHINAIGADAKGKEELETSILKLSKVVVDDIHQASEGGEINVPVSQGIFKIEDIYATLCEVVAGKKPGRQNDKEITVFDSTGLAIEDIAVAELIYDKAVKTKGYPSMNFIEG